MASVPRSTSSAPPDSPAVQAAFRLRGVWQEKPGAAVLEDVNLRAVVIQIDPWYNPRYLVPLFGMIIGSGMNAAALAADRLAGEIGLRRAAIEAYLALGGSPALASRDAVRSAMRLP